MSPKKSKQKSPKIKTLLGERIYQCRQAKNLSEEQLAMRLGVKAKTIRNWENERTAPRANRLHQLAGILDVPLAWLLAGAEAPPEIEQPKLNETSGLESKLEQADQLINQLSMLITDLRANTRQVQREFDLDG